MSEATMAGVHTREVPWWLVLIQGILTIIIGILLLTNTALTTAVLIQIMGIYWLISGIFGIVSIFLDHSMWGLKLLWGVLGILAGLLIIQHPLWSSVIVLSVIVIVMGINGLIIGMVNLIQAFQGGGWGAGIMGVINIVCGLILLFNVSIGMVILPYVIGIFALIGGIAALFMAFRMR